MADSLKFISESFRDFPEILESGIKSFGTGVRIAEIGAGANPFLSEGLVKKYNIDYHVYDIDPIELEKAKGRHFQKNTWPPEKDRNSFELVFSKMVLEHIKDPEPFHREVYNMLKPGGRAIHFFATLYAPASLVNLILPEWLSSKLLFAIQKRDPDRSGKFPAFYRWCVGPVKRQFTRFERIKFKVVCYNGYLGQNYLFGKPVYVLEKIWNRLLLWIKSPHVCSNAIVVLLKDPE